MMGTELLAVAAVLFVAAAVLPGTLGILMFTNRFAIAETGARYIYGRAFWVGAAGALVAFYALFRAIGEGPQSYFSPVFVISVVAFGAVLVWGFFMHTKLMFKPVRKPLYISVEEAVKKFGPREEVVGVIDPGGKPWAYIARLSRRPHIVYQPDGDDPFIMSHCILAHSSMSYAMADRFKAPDITITAALANNMVFYDKSNQCSVIQLHNGSHSANLPLKTLPTLAMSLGTWARLYPETKIWYRNVEWRDLFYLKLLARADVIDPKSPVVVYPLQHGGDNRLPLKSQVMGVQVGGVTMTYPQSLFENRQPPLINDRIGAAQVVLVAAYGCDYINIFDREVEGRVLSFKRDAGGENIVDNETGSSWKVTGECISGPLEGKALRPIPHYNKIFWYVWSDFHPGTPIYGRNAVAAAAE